jgi:lipopolysaccharide export system permease protein
MSRLASYIVTSVLRGTALVAAVLVAVASVIELVGQFDDVGLGTYGVQEALVYVALRIPRKLFDVLPAAALIGSLLGLGNLAVHRELVVMRTSGISQYRLLGSVSGAGLILLIVMALLGESLAPRLGNYARTMRADALLDEVDTPSLSSTWLPGSDEIIIHLSQSESGDGSGQHVRFFELDGDTGLSRFVEGELIAIGEDGYWDMLDYAETRFTARGVTHRNEGEVRENLGFGREMLELTEGREDLLELLELGKRIGNLRERGVDASVYLAAYWGRIADSVSVVLMTMLALPFVLGSLRSAGAGARMVIGLVIGLAHFVLGELSANTGQVFALDPVFAAWAPSAVLLLITALALLRLR